MRDLRSTMKRKANRANNTEPPSKMGESLRKEEAAKENQTVKNNFVTYYNHGNLKSPKYEWSICDLTLLCATKEPIKLVSPIIFSGDNNEFKWKLVLQLLNECAEHESYFGMYLVSLNDVKVIITCTIDFKINGWILKTKDIIDSEINSGKKFGLSKFIKKDLVLNSSTDDSNSRVVIVLEMKRAYSNSVCISTFNTGLFTILNNLETVLNDGRFSDITLISGDEKFKAHKVILALQTNILSKTEVDSKQNISLIIIYDVKPTVLKEMLRFIYTSKIENLENLAESLLVAAMKYAVNDLVSICLNYLSTSLSVENSVDRLVFADENKIAYLRDKAMNFIVLHAIDVINRPEFSKIEKLGASISKKLFCSLAALRDQNKKNEIIVL